MQVVYSKHGKHPKEALFYTHALPLPGFLLLGPDILKHWQVGELGVRNSRMKDTLRFAGTLRWCKSHGWPWSSPPWCFTS